MGKKKATGMSKRLGFTDRATIAENKDILRYNDRLEREAKGLPPEAPRAEREGRPPRTSGPGRRDHAERNGAATAPRAPRAPRPARPVRPPGLDEEQTVILQTALGAAVGETGLDSAGAKVIERLTAHDSFDRATNAGWELAAAGGNAAERTESEWALLRKTWLTIRIALLEAYALIKPELAAAVERERKQLARIERPRRSPRRRPEKAAGEPGERPRQRGPKPARTGPKPGAPTPADVARVAGHAEIAGAHHEAAATAEAEPVADQLPETPEAAVPEAPGAEVAVPESSATEVAVPENAVPESAVPDPSPVAAPEAEAAEPEPADSGAEAPEPEPVQPAAPVDGTEIAAELRAEHRGLEPRPAPEEAENKDQLTLGF